MQFANEDSCQTAMKHLSQAAIAWRYSHSASIFPNSDEELGLHTAEISPVLWSPETPKLYKLVTTVEVDGKVVDQKETEFGIRTVRLRREQRISAERQALRTQRHLQPSGHGGRRRGAAGCAAVFPHREIEGIRLQRHPHLAQSAHAGTARCLRPSRHDRHGRKPPARQRRAESAASGTTRSAATAITPASASGASPTRNFPCRTRRRAPTSRARCRIM